MENEGFQSCRLQKQQFFFVPSLRNLKDGKYFAPPDIAGPPDCSGLPDWPTTGPPDRYTAGPPARRTAGQPKPSTPPVNHNSLLVPVLEENGFANGQWGAGR